MSDGEWDAALSWLHAQLDAEAAIAEAAGGDTWTASDSGIYPEDASNHPGPFAVGPYGHLSDEYGAHIARHSPAAILRRTQADRRLLNPMEWPGSGPDHEDSYRFAVQAFALRYAHVPGFPEVLRPAERRPRQGRRGGVAAGRPQPGSGRTQADHGVARHPGHRVGDPRGC